ncbi:MAG: hypothetical protein ACI4L9_00895 [Candidatus Coproplasma sp.]
MIMIIAELAVHFAAIWFSSVAYYTFSFIVPICLAVMVRWGWPSVLYALLSGVLYCALNGGGLVDYCTYCIGNSFILFALIPLKVIGDKKITSKWYFSALYAVLGWALVYLGRATVWAICFCVCPVEGLTATQGFVDFAITDLLSMAMAVVVVLVLRKFDGMFENQVSYLKRVDKERRDRMKYDAFGDEPVEIDGEALSILNKDNDLY